VGSNLFKRTTIKRIALNHVCEIGVGSPETSNVIDFIRNGITTTLVEAEPTTVDRIRNYYSSFTNVTLYPVAVADEKGSLSFYKRGDSTFASNLPFSPSTVNDRYKAAPSDQFIVPAVPFNEIDNGCIDLLSIDIEGGEWFVLKHLISRPIVLSIETHGKCYKNPFYNEISKWTKQNGYDIWYLTKSDTIYILSSRNHTNFLTKVSVQFNIFRFMLLRGIKRLEYKLFKCCINPI
jgi:FkbM family methyltransferase